MKGRQTGRVGIDFIGVGVAAALFNTNDAIALFHRRRGGESGLWGLPGGRVRIGESLLRAVRREMREELGVKVIRCRQIGLCEDLRPEGHWISALFVVDEFEGEPSNRLPLVHHQLAWALLGDPPGEVTFVTRYMIEQLQRQGERWPTRLQP
jgi:8-oxo-dGTP diphosphatase